jgi:hypothetical protein
LYIDLPVGNLGRIPLGLREQGADHLRGMIRYAVYSVCPIADISEHFGFSEMIGVKNRRNLRSQDGQFLFLILRLFHLLLLVVE